VVLFEQYANPSAPDEDFFKLYMTFADPSTVPTFNFTYQYNNVLQFNMSFDAVDAMVINTWYHIALIRGWGGNANDYMVTVEGEAIDTEVTDSTSLDGLIAAAPWNIGYSVTSPPADYTLVKLDRYRFTKGEALWTENFDVSELGPPVVAVPVGTEAAQGGDVGIDWDSQALEGDFLYQDGDFTRDAGLETAVIVSLFTDRKAEPDDELPDPNSSERRGWWGDLTIPDLPSGGDKYGSKLWLLERSKTTPEVIAKAKQYIEEALDWLVEDGVAFRVEVEVERQGTVGSDVLAFHVKIHRGDNDIVVLNFSDQWAAQFAEGS
jgi:phage gp46-like protein